MFCGSETAGGVHVIFSFSEKLHFDPLSGLVNEMFVMVVVL